MVEFVGEGAGRTLLVVLRQFVLEVAPPGRDEAGGRAHRPAPFQTDEPGRHRASARVAGDADVARIDLGTREEVVERADPVPGPPRSEEFADEFHLVAGVVVLGRRTLDEERSRRIDILRALALSDGIEDEAGRAETGESLGETLVGLGAFAVVRVAATADDAGHLAALSFLRQVEVRGDEKTSAGSRR